ncbi:MAG: hypothetical protein M9894_14825 [Planctomycetes bacterium]|nr:hypothetical protein [Planctomycetota bacterium]
MVRLLDPRTWFAFGPGSGAPSSGGGGIALAAGSGGPVDLSDFARASWGLDVLGAGDLVTLAGLSMGIRPDTPPEHVPVPVLDAVGWHPTVALSEHLATAPATDPELYYLRGDPAACAEVEAWLRPLLTLQRAPLLAQIVRAFAYGAVPIVLDWRVRDLTFSVPGGDGNGSRNRNIIGHTHYGASHEIWPGDAQLRVKDDRLLGVLTRGGEYGGEDLDEPGRRRAYLAAWDPAFGRWQGQASRRRAYRDWFEESMARLWEIRYTERSVDLPRVGFAPAGNLRVNGEEVSAASILRGQLQSLRNGSVIALPSTRDEKGNQAWDARVLDHPDRHAIFEHAITSRSIRLMQAALCPGRAPDKAGEEQLMDTVQRVCDFAARTLTRIVRSALELRHGPAAPFVQVLANDVPKRKLRLAQDVFRTCADGIQRLPDGRQARLKDLIHPEIFDQLGIRARPLSEVARDPGDPTLASHGQPGRPREATSDREERRDAARTVEGEYDTGGASIDREPRY